MIGLEDIVETLSANVKTEKGILVLHRSMTVHPKFKVYKIFHYNLFLVKGNVKTLVLAHGETRNTPADDILKIWNECDKSYLSKLMKWVAGDEYRALIKDEI